MRNLDFEMFSLLSEILFCNFLLSHHNKFANVSLPRVSVFDVLYPLRKIGHKIAVFPVSVNHTSQ